jgi:hypothetical protein
VLSFHQMAVATYHYCHEAAIIMGNEIIHNYSLPRIIISHYVGQD